MAHDQASQQLILFGGQEGPNFGGGTCEVAADGGIFAFGSAPFDGSMGGQHLDRPVVAMAPSRS